MFQQLITWFSEICLMSLIALFWNFLLLFSRSKNIWMSSTLIRVIITYQLLIIIIIIITKCHSNYCSVAVAVMELCLLNLLILIVFYVILTLVSLWELATWDYISTYKHDFMCLSETYLDSSTPSNIIDIQGYKLIRSDHPDNIKRGGVCIYYKESLPVRVINLPFFKEALLLEMCYNKKKCLCP